MGLARRQVECLEGEVPAETEMAVLGPDRELVPLADDGVVGRLLKLGDEQARPDRVGSPAGTNTMSPAPTLIRWRDSSNAAVSWCSIQSR